MKRFWIRRAARFLGFAIVLAGLAGLTVMTLWNALLPSILGVSAIGFWQALGLLLLSRILFGGYGVRGRGWEGGWKGRRAWKEKMAERWQQITPEEREQMKARWRDRCSGRGRWGSPPSDPRAE
ncbi:hypothetical protein [Spirosoma sp. 209]|uniref:hypothetical protein n=1 Tax=Spirosoma sp. 209 TaxID=1955701 RepID=UPI00098D6F0E|nr:hypothetical protein [Spirosoma sp. 209]